MGGVADRRVIRGWLNRLVGVYAADRVPLRAAQSVGDSRELGPRADRAAGAGWRTREGCAHAAAAKLRHQLGDDGRRADGAHARHARLARQTSRQRLSDARMAHLGLVHRLRDVPVVASAVSNTEAAIAPAMRAGGRGFDRAAVALP